MTEPELQPTQSYGEVYLFGTYFNSEGEVKPLDLRLEVEGGGEKVYHVKMESQSFYECEVLAKKIKRKLEARGRENRRRERYAAKRG